MEAAAWRRETRGRLIDRRLQMIAESHRQASTVVEGLLEEILKQFTPRTISAYWPFKNEVNLHDLMEKLRIAGWQTALPVVMGTRMPLQFRQWRADSQMDHGVYQIPIPSSGEVVQPDIVVTPLVGFDEKNYRLGYGAGYFDITLAGMTPRPMSIGVGFELGRLDTIHPLPTDVPMDIIITEAGIQQQSRAFPK